MVKLTKKPYCLSLVCCMGRRTGVFEVGIWHADIIKHQNTMAGCSLGHVAACKETDSTMWQIQNVASTCVIFRTKKTQPLSATGTSSSALSKRLMAKNRSFFQPNSANSIEIVFCTSAFSAESGAVRPWTVFVEAKEHLSPILCPLNKIGTGNLQMIWLLSTPRHSSLSSQNVYHKKKTGPLSYNAHMCIKK